jgi:small-conductance mechanosensitive channel
MDGLFQFLFHSTEWSQPERLPPGERLLLALSVLVLALGGAGLAGLLFGRWSRSRAGAEFDTRHFSRVRRRGMTLIALVGASLAFQIAPLPSLHFERVVSGTLFVAATLVGSRLIVDLVTLVISFSVAHVATGERDRIEREYVPLVSKLVTVGVALIWVIIVLKHFGQDVTSLVAALGVGSLAIGLAAQQTLGNMFAGFTLLVDRPFRPGDRIRLASGEVGEVREIGVRSTRIVLGDRNLLVVPNTDLANSRVANLTHLSLPTHSEVRLTVVYGSDVEKLSALIVRSIEDEPLVLREPKPTVRVVQLGDRGIELLVGFEVGRHDEAPLAEDRVRRQILRIVAQTAVELAQLPRHQSS